MAVIGVSVRYPAVNCVGSFEAHLGFISGSNSLTSGGNLALNRDPPRPRATAASVGSRSRIEPCKFSGGPRGGETPRETRDISREPPAAGARGVPQLHRTSNPGGTTLYITNSFLFIYLLATIDEKLGSGNSTCCSLGEKKKN